jgi:hypothetical protein
MLIRVLSIELILCLFYSFGLIANEPGDDTPALILQTWAMCAIARILISRLNFDVIPRRSLAFVFSAMLLISTIPGTVNEFPYWHQALFVTSATSLIFLSGNALSKKLPQYDRRRAWAGRALLILALPIAVQVWSAANIAFVSFAARQAAQGEASCLLVGDAGPLGYRQSHSLLDLLGLSLYVPYINGGGSHSFQWTFHSLLMTNSRRLFNWSYQSQRFEPLTDESIRSHRLEHISCSFS